MEKDVVMFVVFSPWLATWLLVSWRCVKELRQGPPRLMGAFVGSIGMTYCACFICVVPSSHPLSALFLILSILVIG
jgi:hypothetical protein